MFHYISGELAQLSLSSAVIDVGGVGYMLTISGNTYEKLCRSSSAKVKLYTYLAVREDGIELFGFESEAEMSTFKMLLGVSGVGPKAAISILSLLTPEKFALAVCTDDKKTISKASGIGPKTAARIILELKDKLAKDTNIDTSLASAVSSGGGSVAPTASGKLTEAQDALMVLGYSRAEAQKVLASLDTQNMNLEDIIKAALKHLMR
ncbi:MAG: Holliday junction branch migration protein RuvA [Ruminococcaceae bacterium]|nr:Holliday junction branch migration protein RuvA [Oscillospiraceae bacterium]